MGKYTNKKVNNTPKAKKIKKRLEELGHKNVEVWYEPIRSGVEMSGYEGGWAFCSDDCDDDFEAQRTAINQYMDEIIGTPNRWLGKCVGIGGTITTLAALSLGMREYDRDEIEKAVLNKSEVEQLIVGLNSMGAERKLNPLLRERHDIIIYGAAVLAHAMAGRD